MSDLASGSPRPAGRLWLPLSLLLILVAVIWPYRHFAGDDAYITFRYVRNLADGLGFSFNPGVASYGSTAPLWVILVALVHRLGLAVVDAAHALNWLFSVLAVLAFWRWSGLFLERTAVRWTAGLLFVLNPWFVRWSLSGMENSLALCLLFAALIAQHLARNSGRIVWVPALLGGLASLTRPEMVLFSGLLFADLVLFERRRLLASLAASALAYAAVLIPWLLYAHASFGTVVPNTITAKLSRDHALAAVQTLKLFASYWPFQALAVALALWIDRGRLGRTAPWPWAWGPWFVPVAWAIVLPLFYIVGGAPVAGRYGVFAVPCFVLIGARAWELLLARWPARRAVRGWIVASVVATLILMGFVHYRYCWFVTKWPQGMDPALIGLAEKVRSVSSEGDVVACDQIGVIGYFSERTILDILGLVSPEVLPHLKSEDRRAIWRYIRSRTPEFLIVVNSKEEMVLQDPGYASLELLDAVGVQREGAGAMGRVLTYRFYRTHW